MQEDFENSIKNILNIIGENPNRQGLMQTPKRVFEAFKFLTSGYEIDAKSILKSALFSSTNKEMVLVRDINFYSLCEHHLLPIIGQAYIAYLPNEQVVGLSKIPRVVDVFARRLQIQEQLTDQIAECIFDAINPKGVGVYIKARHMCMEMRGVQKENSQTITSAFRGEFLSNTNLKNEFYSLIKG